MTVIWNTGTALFCCVAVVGMAVDLMLTIVRAGILHCARAQASGLEVSYQVLQRF